MTPADLILPGAEPLPPVLRTLIERARTLVDGAAAAQDVGNAATALSHVAGGCRILADQLNLYGLPVQGSLVAVAAAALDAAVIGLGDFDEETLRGEIDRAADRALDSLMAALDAEREQVMALPPATEVAPALEGFAA